MKTFFLITLVGFFTIHSEAQSTYIPSSENFTARIEFQDMKFGMFIHWGASSVLGAGEWVMNQRNIKVNEYTKLIHIFNPQNFDAAKWVGIAKSAGMKYITFITRHHDGFSNWDTKQSDWKITNTPYAKDALKQLADECHKQGIRLFCYYSLLDWYRSDYQYETGRTGKGSGRTEKCCMNDDCSIFVAIVTPFVKGYKDSKKSIQNQEISSCNCPGVVVLFYAEIITDTLRCTLFCQFCSKQFMSIKSNRVIGRYL